MKAPRKHFLLSVMIIITALCLVTGLCSVFSFAANTVNAASQMDVLNAVGNARTTATEIVLTQNFTIDVFPIIIPDGSDVTIIPKGDITLTRASGYSDGSLFEVSQKASLTFNVTEGSSLTIDGNSVQSSAPAVSTSGTFMANGVTFKNNTSTGNGAVINASGGTCNIYKCTFTDNAVKGDGVAGGCIYMQSTKSAIDLSTFKNNTADPDGNGSGGAICAMESSITLTNSVFTGNTAVGGGAVFYKTTDSTIENCDFENNIANNKLNIGMGGAIAIQGGGNVKILSGNFENNSSGSWGGAIYTDGQRTDLLMNYVMFEKNHATDVGGAIWHCPLGTAHYYKYSGMTFNGNTADSQGDDISIEAAETGYENGGEYFSDMNYAGDSLAWYQDFSSARYSSGTHTAASASAYQYTNAAINLHSGLSTDDYNASKDKAQVKFISNTSACGGAIANNGFIEVGYKTGLTIEKEVTGDSANKDDTFSFTVTFPDGGTYDGITTGSVITLKAGEKYMISNIPYGTFFSVTEEDKDNYTAEEKTIPGAILDYGTDIKFINTYTAPATTSLSVQKIWSISSDSVEKPESITVQLFCDGNAYGEQVSLSNANDWTNVWKDLAVGHAWTVDEISVPDGYSKQITNDGTDWIITNTYITPDTTEAPDTTAPETSTSAQIYDTEAPIENSSVSVPKTSDTSFVWMWIAFAIISVSILCTVLVKRKFSYRN